MPWFEQGCNELGGSAAGRTPGLLHKAFRTPSKVLHLNEAKDARCCRSSAERGWEPSGAAGRASPGREPSPPGCNANVSGYGYPVKAERGERGELGAAPGHGAAPGKAYSGTKARSGARRAAAGRTHSRTDADPPLPPRRLPPALPPAALPAPLWSLPARRRHVLRSRHHFGTRPRTAAAPRPARSVPAHRGRPAPPAAHGRSRPAPPRRAEPSSAGCRPCPRSPWLRAGSAGNDRRATGLSGTANAADLPGTVYIARGTGRPTPRALLIGSASCRGATPSRCYWGVREARRSAQPIGDGQRPSGPRRWAAGMNFNLLR